MNEGMIRVRDFAKNCGCTPQNIYGHLKTYAVELEGHTFQGKGRQGVLLDEYAQDFIRSVMYPKEVSVDNELQRQIEELRTALFRASQETQKMAVALAKTEGERDKAVLEAGQMQKLLTASEEARTAELQQASEALEQMRKEAFQRLEEAEAAQAREDELQRKYDAMMRRGFWARLTNKEVE